MKIFNWLKNTARQSLYSPFYILIIGCITLFSWMTGKSLLGISALLLIASFVLIINEDILPLLPCLLFAIFNTSKNDILQGDSTFPILFILVVILIASIISHLISYPLKLKNYKLTIPLLAVTISLFVGGIGFLSFKQYAYGLTFILSLGPCMLVLYYIIRQYIRPPQNINHKVYTCQIMLVLGLIVSAQVIITMLRSNKPIIELFRDLLELGWSNRNGAGMILNICFPCCFYLAYSNKPLSPIYYAIGLAFYGIILLTFSRGGILAGTLILVCIIIYTFVKGANRSQFVYTISVLAIICSIVALTHKSSVTNLIEKIIESDFSTSGRDDLYAEALENFIINPVFGAGIGYVGNIFDMPEFCIYWYHSTIFQIVGSLGIVGIVAYGYFYLVRGAIMFKNFQRFNITVSLGIIAFEIHSIFDIGTFTPFPFMIIIIALTAIIEYNNTVDSTTFMETIKIK